MSTLCEWCRELNHCRLLPGQAGVLEELRQAGDPAEKKVLSQKLRSLAAADAAEAIQNSCPQYTVVPGSGSR